MIDCYIFLLASCVKNCQEDVEEFLKIFRHKVDCIPFKNIQQSLAI